MFFVTRTFCVQYQKMLVMGQYILYAAVEVKSEKKKKKKRKRDSEGEAVENAIVEETPGQ